MSQQPVSIHQIQAQFGTDSANYEVLTDAAIRSKGVEGAAVEIGVRLGGGLQKIIDGLVESGQTPDKPVFGIDPYGNTIATRSSKKVAAIIPMRCATSV